MNAFQALIIETLEPVLGKGVPKELAFCSAVEYVLPEHKDLPAQMVVHVGTGVPPQPSGMFVNNPKLWQAVLKVHGDRYTGQYNRLCWYERGSGKASFVMLKDMADPEYQADLVAKVRKVLDQC